MAVLLGGGDVPDVAFDGRGKAQLQEFVHPLGGRHGVPGDRLVPDGLDAVRIGLGEQADVLGVVVDHATELLGRFLDGGLLVGLEDGHLGGEGASGVADEVQDLQVRELLHQGPQEFGREADQFGDLHRTRIDGRVIDRSLWETAPSNGRRYLTQMPEGDHFGDLPVARVDSGVI